MQSGLGMVFAPSEVVLDAVLDDFPDVLDKVEIGRMSSSNALSSDMINYLCRLRTNRLLKPNNVIYHKNRIEISFRTVKTTFLNLFSFGLCKGGC